MKSPYAVFCDRVAAVRRTPPARIAFNILALLVIALVLWALTSLSRGSMRQAVRQNALMDIHKQLESFVLVRDGVLLVDEEVVVSVLRSSRLRRFWRSEPENVSFYIKDDTWLLLDEEGKKAWLPGQERRSKHMSFWEDDNDLDDWRRIYPPPAP